MSRAVQLRPGLGADHAQRWDQPSGSKRRQGLLLVIGEAALRWRAQQRCDDTIVAGWAPHQAALTVDSYMHGDTVTGTTDTDLSAAFPGPGRLLPSGRHPAHWTPESNPVRTANSTAWARLAAPNLS